MKGGDTWNMTISEETIVGNVILELMKKNFICKHRKMWNWIADQTLKLKRKMSKQEYFKVLNIPIDEIPYNLCYCCEYAKFSAEIYNNVMCDNCPIDWKSNAKYCQCLDVSKLQHDKGSYFRWMDTQEYKESARLARIIANLPESE